MPRGVLNVLDWGGVGYRIGTADPQVRHLMTGEELGGQLMEFPRVLYR